MKKSIWKKKYVVCILALFCSALWGIGFPLIKVGYEHMAISQSDTYSKLLFAGVRFLFAGIFVTLINLKNRKKLNFTPKLGVGILSLALLQTVLLNTFQYIGLSYANGNISSVISQGNIFLVTFLSPLFFAHDRLTAKKIIGATMGLLGIVVMNIKGFAGGVSMKGEGFVAIASVMMTMSFILSKKLTAHSSTGLVTGLHQMIGGAMLTAIGLLGGGHLTLNCTPGMVTLAFLIFSGATANLLFMILIKYNDISEVAIYKFATPLFGVIFSFLLLGESFLSINNLIALVLVCTGIIIVSKKSIKN